MSDVREEIGITIICTLIACLLVLIATIRLYDEPKQWRRYSYLFILGFVFALGPYMIWLYCEYR